MSSGNVPVHTLTADNGKDFADHSRVTEVLDVKFYFARPNCVWECGLNERTNALVGAGVLPKWKWTLARYSGEEGQKVQKRLNAHP